MKKIKVFKLFSKDRKYSFLKFKDGEEYVTLNLRGETRPNAFPCLIEYDEKDNKISKDDRGFKLLELNEYEIFYEYYNVKKDRRYEIQV